MCNKQPNAPPPLPCNKTVNSIYFPLPYPHIPDLYVQQEMKCREKEREIGGGGGEVEKRPERTYWYLVLTKLFSGFYQGSKGIIQWIIKVKTPIRINKITVLYIVDIVGKV